MESSSDVWGLLFVWGIFLEREGGEGYFCFLFCFWIQIRFILHPPRSLGAVMFRSLSIR